MAWLQDIPAAVIAIAIPGTFLILVYTLDLYASRSFRFVLICFLWGTVGGIGIAYLTNKYIVLPLINELDLSRIILYVAIAPIVEETLKALPIYFVSRNPKFTYFVDGAIYGFASGIGFSITENFMYIYQHPDTAAPLALIRAFSTCLMHGTATALIGAAFGRFYSQKSAGSRLMIVGGWAAALLLHSAFNGVAVLSSDIWTGSFIDHRMGALAALFIGSAGFAGTILYIRAGLREEQKWLIESIDQGLINELKQDLTPQEQAWLSDTLDREAGISVAEVRAGQAIEMLNEVLAPVRKNFPRKAEQIQQIVLQRARIGIKHRLAEKAADPEMAERMNVEIARMEEEVKQMRQQAGGAAALYLQCVFDEKGQDLQQCVDDLIDLTETDELQLREAPGEA